MKLTASIEQEQESNRGRFKKLTMMMRQSDEQGSDMKAFICEIRKYATLEELDETVLNRLISWIVVGEVKKIDIVLLDRISNA